MFKNTEFIDRVKKEMKIYEDMVMLVAYGDYNYKPDLFSNLFIILYSEDNDHIKKIEQFKKITKEFFDLKYEILEEQQAIFYTREDLKINFKIKKSFSIENDKELLEKKGINWDESVLVRRNYIKKEFNKDNINNFIKNFDDFFTNYFLGDFIKAYKHFNNLLYILFDLKGIYNSTEQSRIWYAKNHESKKDLDDFVKASSELNPNTMIKKIKKIKKLFKDIITKEDFDQNKIIDILDSIEKKYPYFFNLRDISRIPNMDSEKVILNEGLVYRSASLERYDEEDIEIFMRENEITKIVDLRDQEELALYKEKRNTFYSKKFKEKYVVNIPIHLTEVKNLFHDDEQLNHYYHFLKT
ncbi:MAG: tyrosine-protein phosphatase, partial [Thermotogota bacterium]